MKKYTVLFILLIITACAVSPTGRRQLMIVSPQQAIEASNNAYVQTLTPLQESGKLDLNPQISSRIRHIAGKIIAQAVLLYPYTGNWNWDIHVIDDNDTINAWCMAGGKMAIHTGLLVEIEPTDDELAQVIGHEIAHALANHTAEKMSVALASQIGLTTVGIASGGNNGSNATLASAALAAGLAIQLPNSRRAEEEADLIGIELAARAGYDPRAAETLWRKMTEVGDAEIPEFLSTHPNPVNRISTLRRLVPLMLPYYEEEKERPLYLFD
ncbi:MAG: M48 family metallopeptidase [Desulfopila sp.]|nr:M48 family metallopeptidase [Desulfopila sp.]